MRKQCVAQQHRGRRTEFARGRGAAAANTGLVHDIVVHKDGEMDELDDGGDAHEIGRNFRRPAPAAQKHE